MRTTFTLDEDAYEAAQAHAQATGKQLGRVLPGVVRRGPTLRINRHISLVCSIALAAMSASLAISPCFADSVAYSCSHATQKNIAVTTRLGACAGFVWKRDQDTPIQAQFPMLISGEVLGSNDGRTVVAIQSNLRGGMKPDGTLYAADDAGSKGDPAAVLIYRDGKQIAVYHLAELLLRPRMVTVSVSHVQWLRGMSAFAQSNGRKLVLSTTSLREITFDLQSGHIEMQRDSREWTDCDVIAYGPVSRLGTLGQMAAPYLAKGSATKALGFTIAPELELGNGGSYESLCLKNRPPGLVAVSTIPVMYNALAHASQPAPQAPAAQVSRAPNVHFDIDLQVITDVWRLIIKFDIPLQQLDARVVGTEKWSHSGVDLNGVAYVDIEHIPEDALIEIQAVDGFGKKIGPYRQRFDTKAVVRRLFTAELARAPERWVDISQLSNGNISFHELVERRCALREIRYSIDNKSLDQRFPLPQCDFADPNGGDFTENISWPTMPKFVAVQVVFSDGSVSKVMIEGAKN